MDIRELIATLKNVKNQDTEVMVNGEHGIHRVVAVLLGADEVHLIPDNSEPEAPTTGVEPLADWELALLAGDGDTAPRVGDTVRVKAGVRSDSGYVHTACEGLTGTLLLKAHGNYAVEGSYDTHWGPLDHFEKVSN